MKIEKDKKSTLEVLFKLSLLLYGPFPFFQASSTSEQAVLSSISTSVGTEGQQIGLHLGGTTMSAYVSSVTSDTCQQLWSSVHMADDFE